MNCSKRVIIVVRDCTSAKGNRNICDNGCMRIVHFLLGIAESRCIRNWSDMSSDQSSPSLEFGEGRDRMILGVDPFEKCLCSGREVTTFVNVDVVNLFIESYGGTQMSHDEMFTGSKFKVRQSYFPCDLFPGTENKDELWLMCCIFVVGYDFQVNISVMLEVIIQVDDVNFHSVNGLVAEAAMSIFSDFLEGSDERGILENRGDGT